MPPLARAFPLGNFGNYTSRPWQGNCLADGVFPPARPVGIGHGDILPRVPCPTPDPQIIKSASPGCRFLAAADRHGRGGEQPLEIGGEGVDFRQAFQRARPASARRASTLSSGGAWPAWASTRIEAALVRSIAPAPLAVGLASPARCVEPSA